MSGADTSDSDHRAHLFFDGQGGRTYSEGMYVCVSIGFIYQVVYI